MTQTDTLNRIAGHRKLWILTGAGLSAASGLPTYRDDEGNWKAANPVQHQDFINQAHNRQRYWSRSMVGWPSFREAAPNAAHLALTRIQQSGRVHQLVTQNVDRLHSKSGSTAVIDLHGRLDRVICMQCGHRISRHEMQDRLLAANPELSTSNVTLLPDGDAAVSAEMAQQLVVPDCERCDGMLKPDVVFFGDNVPGARVAEAYRTLQEADAALFIGSSLQVMSGYRFCVQASKQAIPLYCINRGQTRADHLFDAKLEADLSDTLHELSSAITEHPLEAHR